MRILLTIAAVAAFVGFGLLNGGDLAIEQGAKPDPSTMLWGQILLLGGVANGLWAVGRKLLHE